MKLLINADDAGIDAARNRGIFEAIDNGVVRNISVIVYQPGWADILDRISGRSDIGIGLHVNLTSGRPVVEGHRTLVDERGFFFDKFELFRRAHEGLIDSKEAASEFAAQLEKLQNSGIKPTHIDGHNHVHIFPGAREGFADVFPEGSWVRLPVESGNTPVDSAGVDLKTIYNDSGKLVSVFNFLAVEAKKEWGNRFRYVDDFCGTKITSASVLDFIKAVGELKGEVCELMCHPGAAADEDCANFSKLKERQMELEVLTSDGFKSFLKFEKIKLASFRDLKNT